MKFDLSNGNTLAWLDKKPIHGCTDVLFLAGGDVVFLKEERREISAKIRDDLQTMDKSTFFSTYCWPNNSSGDELYSELKDFYARRFQYPNVPP
jgi:hypothetical protein